MTPDEPHSQQRNGLTWRMGQVEEEVRQLSSQQRVQGDTLIQVVERLGQIRTEMKNQDEDRKERDKAIKDQLKEIDRKPRQNMLAFAAVLSPVISAIGLGAVILGTPG